MATLSAREPCRFVIYLRVSTEGQSRSGLELEAQRQAVATYLAQHGGGLLAEFQEIEIGRKNDRPQLAAALACCRTRRAALLVAKLDRLSRDARFLLGLVEGAGEAWVVFCDLPRVPPVPTFRRDGEAERLGGGEQGMRHGVELAATRAAMPSGIR